MKMWTALSTCMCAKNANWTSIALTNRIHDAARNACRFHRRNGAWKIFNMKENAHNLMLDEIMELWNLSATYLN
jgi:hypothetical protein